MWSKLSYVSNNLYVCIYMKTITQLTTALILVTSLFFGQAATAETEPKLNGIWVWDDPVGSGTASNILDNQSDFIDFLKSPHGNSDRAINRVFFQIPLENLDVSQTKIISLIKNLHLESIKIDLLAEGNNGSWLYDDNASQTPKDYCDKVVVFNNSVGSNEKLDGIHFDIEPHIVEGDSLWRNRGDERENYSDPYNDDMQYRYIKILEHCKEQFSLQNEGKPSITIDLGDDYYHYVPDLWKPITENNLVDYIAVMNYYDNNTDYYQGKAVEDTLIGGVSKNIAAIPLESNVKLIFGLETSGLDFAPDEISFYQEGVGALHSLINKLHNDPLQIEGTAVHKYDSYKDLVNISDEPISCNKNGATLEITNIPSNIGCIMRTDTYQDLMPDSSRTAIYDNVTGTPDIEIYEINNNPGMKDCSGYVSSLQCTIVEIEQTEPVSCSKNGTTLEIINIPSNVGCIMRADTYQDATPNSGTVIYNNVIETPNIEMYQINNNPGMKDCSVYVSEVICD